MNPVFYIYTKYFIVPGNEFPGYFYKVISRPYNHLHKAVPLYAASIPPE